MVSDGVLVARNLVRQYFPHARSAWLGGSVAVGHQTSSSDLDITVLLDGRPAPFRTSLTVDGWPVEFFVQTEESLMAFCDDDRVRRRRPTTMRLVGSSIVLVDKDGSGRRLQSLLHQMDLDGPAPLSSDVLDDMRYAVTDLLSDVTDSRSDAECLVTAAALLREAGELLLATHCRWSGSGKWLLREIEAFDAEHDSDYTIRLLHGVCVAATGDPQPLHHAVLGVLTNCGGTLFDGFHRDGPQ